MKSEPSHRLEFELVSRILLRQLQIDYLKLTACIHVGYLSHIHGCLTRYITCASKQCYGLGD
jgi:hypothetical protein